LSLAIFDNEKSTQPSHKFSKPWGDVVDLHKCRTSRPDKSGLMLGGYCLTGKRNNENVRNRSLVQLDIDTEVRRDKGTGQIVAVLRQAPTLDGVRKGIDQYEWVANSSHSHDPANGIVKYRIVMLPNRDILPDEHEAVLEALFRRTYRRDRPERRKRR
jgi:hypothetical protein